MPNPSGPDRNDTQNQSRSNPDDTVSSSAKDEADPGADQIAGADEDATESYRVAPTETEAATEVISKPDAEKPDTAESQRESDGRRFTAPGFDAKETAIISTAAEPATEVIQTSRVPHFSPKQAMPQLIPPRLGAKLRPSSQRNWGWVLALIVVILALAAIAILGSVLLTRKTQKVSQVDQVRTTILNFDVAVQKGDLATLRSITCGAMRDSYVNYDEHAWADAYRRVSDAKQYPVVDSIDQVVVNDDHAEANVTAFMAYDPQLRSTRSFDLQFRDDQWKICQSPSS